MLDLENLNTLEYQYKDDILMVHKFLTERKGFINCRDKIVTNVTLNTQFVEFANQCDIKQLVESSISERKNIAPNWKIALTKWIKELKQDLHKYDLEYPTEYANFNGMQSNSDFIFNKVYTSITEGRNGYVYELSWYLVQRYLYTDEKKVCEEYFNQINNAVYYAYLLGKLHLELEFIEDFESNTIGITPLTNKKLIWTGTPGEFGAIMDELLDRGFLEGFLDRKHAANILVKYFKIKGKDGNEVSANYIYECFGKSKATYNPNELKIPNSRNLP